MDKQKRQSGLIITHGWLIIVFMKTVEIKVAGDLFKLGLARP